MPKISKREWGESTDPESEEYSPTMQNLKDEERLKQEFVYELQEIEDELANPHQNPYTGKKDKFRAADPEYFLERLARLRVVYGKEKNPKLNRELLDAISKVEQKVYKQFVPFIESQINIFGWQNSPLEEYRPDNKLSAEEVISRLEQTRSVLKNFKLSEDERIDFLNELDRLKEKLSRYQKEPTIFTFEKIEEELQRELHDIEYLDFYSQGQGNAVALEDEGTRKENQKKFDLLLAKAHSMIEIADRILNETIRTHCGVRSRSLLEHVEYLKIKNNAPRELLATEAELKDLFQRIKNGEEVDAEKLDEIGHRLSEIKGRGLGFDYRKVVESLEKLFARTQRIFAGETIDEDDDRFRTENVGVDWAWSLLGVPRNASKDDVRRAYHNLAIKYHPDYNKDAEAKEKMQKINQAFGLIKKVLGL